MITRRQVLAGSAAAMLSSQAWAARHRNVVMIMIDDLLSVVYNRRKFGLRIRTPYLDRLMAQGVSFSNAFASTALCQPSRTSILSGQNPFRTGILDNTLNWSDAVSPISTFPGIMAANGYRCFMYGKISHRPVADPPLWQSSGVCVEAKGLGFGDPDPDAGVVNMAMARLQNDLAPRISEQPWILMLGLIGPHGPMGEFPDFFSWYPLDQLRDQNWTGDQIERACLEPAAQIEADYYQQQKAAGKWPEFIQAYFADITKMDRELGRFMNALDASGVDATVILSSDHGFHLGAHDIMGKFTLWDEAGRSPLVVRYPNCPAGLVIPETVSLLDIGPTILHRVGIPTPARFDGQSLLPFILNPALKRTSGALTTMGEAVSYRDNRYRISRYECGEIELYDQLSDPDSKNNLADELGYETLRAMMLDKLDRRVARWKRA